jgi:hypothetical protein
MKNEFKNKEYDLGLLEIKEPKSILWLENDLFKVFSYIAIFHHYDKDDWRNDSFITFEDIVDVFKGIGWSFNRIQSVLNELKRTGFITLIDDRLFPCALIGL